MRISLSGPAGCGKDTIADAMRRQYAFRPLALADPIREMFTVATGIPARLQPALKEDPDLAPKYRRVMQMLGTEVFRNEWSDNVWIDNIMRRVGLVEDGTIAQGYDDPEDGEPYAGVVVTDTRFHNEFTAFKDAGFVMVDIICPEEHMRCKPGTSAYHHVSERDLDDARESGMFDVVILNDRSRTPEEVAASVVNLTSSIEIKRRAHAQFVRFLDRYPVGDAYPNMGDEVA